MPNKLKELGLTDVQIAFLEGITDQRGAALWTAADLIGDMDADGVAFLRKLSDPEYANLKKFLMQGKPETFMFLTDLRKDEVNELGNAIENARAVRRVSKLVRWGIMTLIGAIVTFSAIWDKIAPIFKITGGKQ